MMHQNRSKLQDAAGPGGQNDAPAAGCVMPVSVLWLARPLLAV
jgi:hypothetical protein